MLCPWCKRDYPTLAHSEEFKVDVCWHCITKLSLKTRKRIRGYKPKDRRAFYELPKRILQAQFSIEDLLDPRDANYSHHSSSIVHGQFLRALREQGGKCSCGAFPMKYFFTRNCKKLTCFRCWKKHPPIIKHPSMSDLVRASLPFPDNFSGAIDHKSSLVYTQQP